MNRFLKYWRISGRGEAFQAEIVNYADDFVILSRGHADQALEWTRRITARIGLTLNEAKTSIKRARREQFDFLGYTFGSHRTRDDGHWYLGASPSRKSVSRIKRKVGDLLQPRHVGTWPEVRDHLNRILRGWSTYFNHGSRKAAYRAIDNYVYQGVLDFLRRRSKVESRGTTRFTYKAVYGELGVLRLRRVHLGPLP
jgi:RNA-directed DNA polymerase